MKRNDSSSDQNTGLSPQNEGARGLIGLWISRCFPVWSDMPPYDHVSTIPQPPAQGYPAKR